MARRWKQWGTIAGALLGLGTIASTAPAQPGAMPPPVFAGNPQQPPSPEFCNPPSGEGPDFPHAGKKKEPVSPFSIDDDLTPGAFDCDDRCRPNEPYCFILRAEALDWRVRNGRLAIPLVTTSIVGDAGNVFGLAQANAPSLLGPGTYSYDDVPGGRVTMGIALGFLPAIEGTGFALVRNRVLFAGNGDGSATAPVLIRPVLLTNLVGQDGLLGRQSGLVVSFPGVKSGSIQVRSDFNLWGVETNAVCRIGSSDVLAVDFLVGYRYAELREGLTIDNSLFGTNTTQIRDNFRTRNQFNGGQLGLRSTLSCWRFNFQLDTKLALGGMYEELDIDGSTSTLPPATTARATNVVPAGLLAVASNSGRFVKNEFAIVPEASFLAGYQVSRNFRVFAGCSGFYMSSVLRPGDHLSSQIDSRLIPVSATFDPSFRSGPPNVQLRSTSFWGYGASVGVELSF